MAGGPARKGFLGATRHLWTMFAIVGFGWAVGAGAETGNLGDSSVYLFFTMMLLAIGLYGSTSDIPLREARQDVRLLLLAITVGVIAKAGLIALVLWFALDQPAYLLLAVAVAQIDPLSVAALRENSRLSSRGRAVLSVWASFDDPVTVLLTAYTAPIALRALDGPPGTGGMGATGGDNLLDYAAQLGWNAALVCAAAVAWLLLRRAGGLDPARWSRTAEVIAVLLLFALVLLAGGFALMLGVAVIGLFFRPRVLQRHISTIVRGAYVVAAFTLGLLLVNGIDLLHGVVLGAAAYGAQMVVGSVLTRKLDRTDRISLALSQQNGVTAIVLALSLEPMFPQAVAIVAPAILTVNCLHFAANSVWNRRQPTLPDPLPDAPLLEMPAHVLVPPWKDRGDGGTPLWKETDALAAERCPGAVHSARWSLSSLNGGPTLQPPLAQSLDRFWRMTVKHPQQQLFGADGLRYGPGSAARAVRVAAATHPAVRAGDGGVLESATGVGTESAGFDDGDLDVPRGLRKGE